MTTAEVVALRDKAVESIARERKIVDAILGDIDGLEGALNGREYFERGGEGYHLPGLPRHIRLSDRAARFCGLSG